MRSTASVIRQLALIRDAVERTYRSRDRRAFWAGQVERRLDDLDRLLAETGRRDEVDAALQALRDALENGNGTPADAWTHHLDELVEAETRDGRRLGLSAGRVRRLVSGTRRIERAGDPSDLDVVAAVPIDAEHLARIIRGIVRESLHELAASRDLPRKRKKAVRQRQLARVGLGLLGAALALGNLLLSMGSSGIPAEVAVGSMSVGATAHAAATFNLPGLIRLLWRGPPRR